jgi:hypothetical protein
MPDDFRADPPVWIWPSGSGTAVEPDVLDVARRNWLRVLSYARSHGEDSSVAANIFESVLLATSRIRRSSEESRNAIRNIDAYVYVGFVRKFNRYLAKQPKIQFVGSLHEVHTLHDIRTSRGAPTAEDELLAKELLQQMNQRARRTFYLRANGYSWKETARLLKTTANSAQVLFNKEIGKLRSRIWKTKASEQRRGGDVDE